MKTLSHKLIITKVPYVSRYASDNQTKTLSVLMNHKECMEISCDIEEERSLIGNIYVGKVKNIVKNLLSGKLLSASGYARHTLIIMFTIVPTTV